MVYLVYLCAVVGSTGLHLTDLTQLRGGQETRLELEQLGGTSWWRPNLWQVKHGHGQTGTNNNLTIHRQHRPGEEGVPLPRPVLAVTDLCILVTDSVPGAGPSPARSLGRRENIQCYKFF